MDRFKGFASLILVLGFSALFNLNTAQAQVDEKDQVLFTLDGDQIYVSDFLYVYNKNNNNDKDKFSKESLEDYLRLYVNFRLKVHEAEELGMDTIGSLNAELKTYRDQLAKSYLYDRKVNEQLLKEAYERMQTEVNASHILIKIDEPGLPSDTLKAYKEALSLRNRVMKGEQFHELARKYSADKSAETNGGNIGWFSALQTVYPFENAAYNTPLGELSMPVRTRFGYHIVWPLERRPAQGEITVSHIMLRLPPNATQQQIEFSQGRANEIYNEAMSDTVSWEDLVKKHSEDKTTRLKGGMLPPFSTGRMVPNFEAAAFALENDGDISKPVMTEYGFHIIKRISKKDAPSYEEVEADLKRRVERDSRSEVAKNTLLNKIKKDYKFTENSKNKDAVYKAVSEQLPNGKVTLADKSKLTKTLFTLDGKDYTQKDFVEYLEKNTQKKRADAPIKIFNDYYNKYVETTLLAYEETKLESKYPEFRMLMREYRDGILLFELTDEKVWTKAVQDTTGLKAFYETVKKNYMWDERANVLIYTVKDPDLVKKARKLGAKKDPETVKNKLNKNDDLAVIVQKLKFSKGDDARVDRMDWKPGLGENIENADGSTSFVRIVNIEQPKPKTLGEAKGFIVSDYQEYLEKQWIKELREKYTVQVNEDVLGSLVK